MAVVTAPQLAALLKGNIDTIDFTSSSLENDELLLRMSEALVVSFSDNNIFSDPASNGGVGASSISLIDPIPTLGWNLEPSGTYSAVSGGPANIQFTVDTSGGWKISGYGRDTIPNSNGRWRPTTDVNTVSYELRITHTGSDAGTIGGVDISGVWTIIDQTMGITLTDSSGSGKTTSVTAEVRVKTNPSNTTTEASFVLDADGGEPL